MAKSFNSNLFLAMKDEQDTEVMIAQVTAVKDILNEIGGNFLNQDEVKYIGERGLEIID
jgi:hypothetical protein